MEIVEKIENDLKKVVEMIEKHLGGGYAAKNPDHVRFLLGAIQQERDRELQTKIHVR